MPDDNKKSPVLLNDVLERRQRLVANLERAKAIPDDGLTTALVHAIAECDGLIAFINSTTPLH